MSLRRSRSASLTQASKDKPGAVDYRTRSPENSKPQPQASGKKSSNTRKEYLAISFGLEFEHTFAFHEDLLREILADFSLLSVREIIKDPRRIPHKHFLSIYPASHQRYRWPSWVLLTTDNDYGLRNAHSIGGRANEKGHYLGKANSKNNLEGQKLWLRPYVLEPLLIARKVLRSKNFSASVNGEKINAREDEFKFQDFGLNDIAVSARPTYSSWSLMNDYTLIGATKQELTTNLPHYISVSNKDDWDSWGVELVSPVFKVSNLREAATSVHDYLSTLRHSAGQTGSTIVNNSTNDAKHAAFDSVWAGTHCHIGLDARRIMAIDYVNLLKHLAFITMAQENLISSLHPRRRRGYGKPIDDVRLPSPVRSVAFQTASEEEDRLVRENEERVADITRRYVALSETKSSRGKFVEWMKEQDLDTDNVTLKSLAQALWDEPNLNKTQGKREELEHLRCALNFNLGWIDSSRNTLIYYGNVIDALLDMVDGVDPSHISKPTIEFRQHAGCVLDANEIFHWLELLFALCRFAEQQAEEPFKLTSDPTQPQTLWEWELSKYDVNPEKETFDLTLSEFFGGDRWLGLDQGEVAYWTERQRRYVNEDSTVRHPASGLPLAPRARKVGRVSKDPKKLRASTRVEEGKAKKAEQWRREQLRQFLEST